MTIYQIVVNGRVRETCGTWSTAQSTANDYERSGCKVEIRETKK